MPFDKTSEDWIAARRRLIQVIKDMNNGSLEGAWPMRAVRERVGKRNERLLYKLRAQYAELTSAANPARLTPAEAEQKLVQMRFPKPPSEAPRITTALKPSAGYLLIAWVKYMALKGRPASQITLLLRQALACHILLPRDPRKAVEANLDRREDRADVLDLLLPESPFVENVPNAPGSTFEQLVRAIVSITEQDVDEMRHSSVLVVKTLAETNLVQRKRPGSLRSRFATAADQDPLDVRNYSLHFSEEDFATLASMPTLESLPRKLRFRCILATPISYKSRTVQYAEVERASPQFRLKLQQYLDRLAKIDPHKLVFVDETSMFKDGFLSQGWGPVGGPALVTVPKSAGARTAVWSGISTGQAYAQIIPPTSRTIASKYRAVNTADKVRMLVAVRANPSWGMPINTYLSATEGRETELEKALEEKKEELGLMELVHLAAKGLPGVYRLLGTNYVDSAAYRVRIQTIADGLVRRLNEENKRTPGQFAIPSVDQLVSLAHADFILRERCSHHNRFEEEAGSSRLFGSGRLGMLRGRFNAQKYARDTSDPSPRVDVPEQANDVEEEEEEELILAADGDEMEALSALSRIAKRVYFDAEQDRDVAFANTVLQALRPRAPYTATEKGDVFLTQPAQRLLGAGIPEYNIQFGGVALPFDEAVTRLATRIGLRFSPEAQTRMQINLAGQKLLLLYMLATGTYLSTSALLETPADILGPEELMIRFPFLRNATVFGNTKGGVERVFNRMMPPFDVARERTGPRAGVLEADTVSVSSNQHLFREFLRSLPRPLVQGKTIILDNASFHGGLRKDEIADLQAMCNRDGICYTGKDIRAELSEEARELRNAGAGTGVPIMKSLTSAGRRGEEAAGRRGRAEVEDVLEGQPALLFLPPYCPQLNPIETVFALVKQAARRALDRVPRRTRLAVSLALRRGFDTLTQGVLRAEYVHSGYFSLVEGELRASAIEPKEFLARAGILGYIKKLIEKRSGRKADVDRRLMDATNAPPTGADIQKNKDTVERYIRDVINTKQGEKLSESARRIISRAYGIHNTSSRNQATKLITDPVDIRRVKQ